MFYKSVNTNLTKILFYKNFDQLKLPEDISEDKKIKHKFDIESDIFEIVG